MSSPVSIPHTQVFDERSDRAEADYQIWVAEPVAGVMPFPPGPRRVLYVLDANLFFGTAVEMTRLMSQLYGELPPLLVVGIGYDTDVPAVQAELRARDFTPTEDSGFDEMTRSMPGAPEPTLPEGRRLGRAAHFLDFLTEEVVPFVEGRYDVAEEGATLFGSSLGGLFTLHALLERPEAFDAYVAVSPAIWWDDAEIMKRAEAVASTRDDLDAELFLAVGGNEERADIPALAPFKMVTNVEAFADRLRSSGYPSLEVTTFVADGESHTTVVPVALTRALRKVIGPAWRPPLTP
jgi:predicted alpha/beta superfamily hydrolase